MDRLTWIGVSERGGAAEVTGGGGAVTQLEVFIERIAGMVDRRVWIEASAPRIDGATIHLTLALQRPASPIQCSLQIDFGGVGDGDAPHFRRQPAFSRPVQVHLRGYYR